MYRASWMVVWALLPGTALALTGGPDDGGYSFTDSTEPDGPTYDFENIAGTGTALQMGDDASATIQLGFEFRFYNEVYTSVSVESNGALLLGGGSIPYMNQCIPAGVPGDLGIYPFWDDLNPSVTTGDVYWEVRGSALDTRLIVQWEDLPQYGTSNSHTFQAKLYIDGVIEFHYENVDTNGSSATVGIQSSANGGLEYQCDAGEIQAGLAISFEGCDPNLDFDEDGYSDCDDCDDSKAYVFPGADDPCDGLDQDCDGIDGRDRDGDGWSFCTRDCDEQDPDVHPMATEIFCDNIDQDCDPWTEDNPDLDGDGYRVCGGDCDDTDPLVSPAATEVLCNEIDDDCSGLTLDDIDADLDGYLGCSEDCNDDDPLISPDAIEVTCNGVDEDCNFIDTPDEPDEDRDADSVCAGDCDDNNGRINSLRAERPCNGIDDDCNPDTTDEVDNDGDGVSVCNGDCNDQDSEIYPGREEITCNAIDDDCDDETEDDDDDDRDGVSICSDDCDDQDPFANPNVSEICGDDIDNDCDLEVDEGCATEDTDGPVTPEPETGCGGCAQGNPGGLLGGTLALMGLVGMRRRRTT